MLYDYRGHKVTSHTGAIDGMRAALGLVPEERLGVVVLTNLNFENLAPGADVQGAGRLPRCPTPWDSLAAWLAGGQSVRRARGAEVGSTRKGADERDTTPSLPLAQYAGVYEDAYCGRLTVTHEDGALVLHYGQDTLRRPHPLALRYVSSHLAPTPPRPQLCDLCPKQQGRSRNPGPRRHRLGPRPPVQPYPRVSEGLSACSPQPYAAPLALSGSRRGGARGRATPECGGRPSPVDGHPPAR